MPEGRTRSARTCTGRIHAARAGLKSRGTFLADRPVDRLTVVVPALVIRSYFPDEPTGVQRVGGIALFFDSAHDFDRVSHVAKHVDLLLDGERTLFDDV